MAKFRVKYGNGQVEEVEQSDCATIDQFVNVKFGSAPAEAEITIVGAHEEEVKEIAKPNKPTKK